MIPTMRVAIVMHWLTAYSGAERCVEQMLRLFPEAELYATVDTLPEAERGFLGGRRVHTSFLQRFPFRPSRYQRHLPLMPLAVEAFDLRGFDLVISSCASVAKGVITGPDAVHLCYCYSPPRYAYDLQAQYLQEAGLVRGPKAWAAQVGLHYLRMWDQRAAAGVDRFVAISRYIQRRIAKAYRREAELVYPPVALDRFPLSTSHEGPYVSASRLVPYKRLDLIARAFSELLPDRELILIGDGPEAAKVRAAAGPKVRVLGHLPHAELQRHVAHASAFLFAAEEDFGIAPVEAMASGTPVIAFGRGGATETVLGPEHGEASTGRFFEAQSPEAIAAAVRAFEAGPAPSPEACRRQAERFSEAAFRQGLQGQVEALLARGFG
jgi:glycosyltransferase involved in cell wall biosynthesis